MGGFPGSLMIRARVVPNHNSLSELYLWPLPPTFQSQPDPRLYSTQQPPLHTSRSYVQGLIRKTVDLPLDSYPTSTMPPKKTTSAAPAKKAAATPPAHPSYRGMYGLIACELQLALFRAMNHLFSGLY